MPRFSYTARDRAGTAVSAVLEAPSRRDALRVLTARGLSVADIREDTSKGKPGSAASKKTQVVKAAQGNILTRKSARITRRERLAFLEALHELVVSGLSAGESVRLLSQRIKEPALRALCVGIWEKLSEGATLSRAMAAYPHVFDNSTINLIQAGEATGSLNDTVKRLVDHLTEQKEMQRQLVSSLAYPIFMVLVAGGVVIFFLTFLLPRLQTLLRSLGGDMPVSTQILIGFSNFALSYGWLVIGLILLAIPSLLKWRHTASGRKTSDAILLKLPLVKNFVVARTVYSFSQTLGVLLENGITAAEALRMTEKQIDNEIHREKFNVATGRVLEGEALSLALARTQCFPDLVLDRLAVGENTGNVVPSLRQISQSYQKLMSNQLNLFTKVIASGVLIAVFAFVGFIAFAIVSAVFQLSSSFAK